MADTSSDDEVPLAQRLTGGGILLAGGGGARRPAASSDSDSDVPSWLQAKGKGNQVINLESSDDDAVISPAKPSQPPATQPASQQPAAAEPAGNRDVQRPAAAQQGAAAAPSPKPRSATKPRATPGRSRAAAAAAAVAPAPAGPDEEAGPSSTQPTATQPTGTQATGTATQATGGGTAQKRAGAAGLPHAATSSMPVVLPEKLAHLKMLVELECSADDAHGVTDLSGDSGAIGRLTMGGTKEEPQMQIDLKGVLYNATIVPCAASLAVVNMGQSEAKVEALFSEFVQLREDTRFSFIDTDLGGLVGADDDEIYAGAEDGEGEGAGAGAAKKGRGKAAAGGGKAAAGKAAAGGKAAPRKRAAPKAKGGVKKPAGKPKPKAKPKPKPAAAKKK